MNGCSQTKGLGASFRSSLKRPRFDDRVSISVETETVCQSGQAGTLLPGRLALIFSIAMSFADRLFRFATVRCASKAA